MTYVNRAVAVLAAVVLAVALACAAVDGAYANELDGANATTAKSQLALAAANRTTALAANRSAGKHAAATISALAPQASSKTTTTVKIGSKKFKMKLASNKSARAFRAYLTKARTLKMTELNGNEKYHYFASRTFPTTEKSYRKVKAGDVMLYGDDCLVIFYKTHKTSYEYTKIGHLTSVKGLAKALGKGSVKVKFAKMRQR